MAEPVEIGERLSAYAAGELDEDERAALEAQLATDPALRAELDRIVAVQEILDDLEQPEPSPDFSARLRAAVAEEVASSQPAPVVDELARRRTLRRSLTPMLAAGAAATVIAVVGVGAGFLLRGTADDGQMDVALESAGAPTVPVVETDNDFNELTLRRVAFSVDTQFIIGEGATREEAGPLADLLVGQLLRTGPGAMQATEAQRAGDATADQQADPETEEFAAVDDAGEEVGPVERCLPTILSGARSPMVPAHVEIAAFDGVPAVIYAFVTEHPGSGTYSRTEVWAVAQDDCQVLGFAQHDH